MRKSPIGMRFSADLASGYFLHYNNGFWPFWGGTIDPFQNMLGSAVRAPITLQVP